MVGDFADILVLHALHVAVADKFAAIKTAITQPIENARTAVKNGLDRIKSLFSGLKLSLPHIKVPHFRISGGEPPWGIMGKGTRPSVSIDWYAQGGIVDDVTLIGAGERGTELVWPQYEPYLSKYADAIAANMPDHGEASVTNNITNNVYEREDAYVAATIFTRSIMAGA